MELIHVLKVSHTQGLNSDIAQTYLSLESREDSVTWKLPVDSVDQG
jgi:hypothetical protein